MSVKCDAAYATVAAGHVRAATVSKSADPTREVSSTHPPQIILVEPRALVRECLAKCLEAALGPGIRSFSSVEKWLEVKDTTTPGLLVLSTGGKAKRPESVQRDVALVSRATGQLPIIMLTDAEEPDQAIEALEKGAKGYIPTSVSLAIAVEAMRLVQAGGVYAPADSIMTANHRYGRIGTRQPTGSGFTTRQVAVLQALRKGKANKIIAYELNMRESTVKVHVRNILKKLKARNRTEAAYIASELLAHEGP